MGRSLSKADWEMGAVVVEVVDTGGQGSRSLIVGAYGFVCDRPCEVGSE